MSKQPSPMQSLIDRDAEREVIGAAMVSAAQLAEIRDTVALKPQDFGIQRHQLIWAAIDALQTDGVEVDIGTVRDELVRRGSLERVGMQALGEALDRAGYSWHGPHYAMRLRRLSLQRRQLETEGTLAVAIAESDHEATGQALERMSKLRDEAMALGKGSAISWGDDVYAAVERALNPRPLDMIPTGLQMLDEHMGGGAERGWLIVVMGPAKSGKSALAINTMAVAAAKSQKSVLVMSLEMSVEDNVRRFLARESGVPARAQRKGDLTTNQRLMIADAGDVVSTWRMAVKTNAGTVDEIAAIARSHQAEHGLDVLVVDYIQLVDNGIQNMAQDVAKTTRALKRLAVTLDCLVIALSQPNNEDAKTGEVGLFSGKGSGAIAADCDAMLVPLRDSDQHDRAGLNLAGFRHGDPHKWPLGSLVFDGGRMVFREPGVTWRVPRRDWTEAMS